jgi:predicted nucleic acid-binding protein
MADDRADRVVVDASVAAKLYFREAGSEAARRLLKSGWTLMAPDLLFIELASVAAKRARRDLCTPGEAAFATRSVRDLIDEVTPAGELADRACEMAISVGVSAYDGCYLALAEAAGCQVLTADERLARRAADGGLGPLVLLLEDA